MTGLEFWFTPPLRLLPTTTIEVLLMAHWLMPRLTRHLARWIYPGRTPTR
jgi:antibiotic biosynthesis monooxygenase (ABM) superfamily enzyme